MKGDNDTNVGLHDQNYAVDNYLDRLLDDGPPAGDYISLPARSNAGGVIVADLRETAVSKRSISSGESPISKSHDRVSSRLEAHSPMCQETDGDPVFTDQRPKALARDVDEGNSYAVADFGSQVVSKRSRAQLLSLFKFQVMGVNFAVPVEQYVGDYPCPDDIASEQDDPKWMLGETLANGKRVSIVDIAVIVIPNYRRHSWRPDSRYRYGRVLEVGKGGWGFICDSNIERIDLPFEEIHWRAKQDKRRWLAGTIVDLKSELLDVSVIDLKCALLDVSVIEGFLEHGKWGE